MKVFIITMDDPVQTRDFIKYVIDNTQHEIVGLAEARGDRLTIGKNRSKIGYLFALMVIMGLPYFIQNVLVTISDKIKKKLAKFGLAKDPSIGSYAEAKGIKTFRIKTPNSKKFKEELKALEPDVVINQSQSIIKQDLIDIPRLGIVNRHNALLPKNRGRLTPFWVLNKGEKASGVSIHFVTEGIDAGDVIVQEEYALEANDRFKTLVNRNYKIAPVAMVKALDILAAGQTEFLPNDDAIATYNTVPTFKDALNYRKRVGWF